ncbi:MAG: hypothetical protein JNK78_03725 [Planctomycetes bacterium]|nr:hypothetical protein [Planctomycetota bacterium]
MFRTKATTALLITALHGLSSCHEEPPPETRLLVVDGITIGLAELDPYLKFLDGYIPEGGRKAKILRILEEHLLPLRLAQRAFPAERGKQLELAKALRSVATNLEELENKTQSMPDVKRSRVTRGQAKLPVAMFLFDPLLTGSVSQPIEMPFGYVLAACSAINEHATTVGDYAEATVVAFATHDNAAWLGWLHAEETRIANKVTFVHPDFREALPNWLVLPKLP